MGNLVTTEYPHLLLQSKSTFLGRPLVQCARCNGYQYADRTLEYFGCQGKR